MSIELLKLENAFEAFRKLKIGDKYATDLQPSAMIAFLMIARGHDQAEQALDLKEKRKCYVTVTDIQDQLRLSTASASRIVASFGYRGARSYRIEGNPDAQWGTEQNPRGYNLVKSERNPDEPLKNMLMLTDQGLDFVRQLKLMLKTNDPNSLEDRLVTPSIVSDQRAPRDEKGELEREKRYREKQERIERANHAKAQGASHHEYLQILRGEA